MRASLSLLWVSSVVLAGALAERPARACGGCFHSPPAPNEVESTVTDHRMVFSISPTQTILWDQIRYAGSPAEFAWVLPVLEGAKVELSHDEWIAALDASTATVVAAPTPPSCPGGFSGGGSGSGCGLGGSAEESAADYGGGTAPNAPGNSQVTVVGESVVGPYEEVTVRSSQGEALGDWLRANGFDVAPATQPVIDAYVAAGFDFIALKLRPNESVNAMQPVRVVTPGADVTLPLRMVAVGVGAYVGLTLFVISEGRYHTANFPDATLDFSQLTWDPVANRSNYTELAAAALAENGGRGWLTEASGPPSLSPYVGYGVNPGLAATYQATCQPIVEPAPPCSPPPAVDAGAGGSAGDGGGGGIDAGDDGAAGDAGEAGVDAGPVETDGGAPGTGVDAGCAPATVVACDDLDVALTGMNTSSVVVTRLRADLPASSLSQDLILEAAPVQAAVASFHQTETYSDPSKAPSCPNAAGSSSSSSSGDCACKTAPDVHARIGGWLAASLIAFGAVRRRARRRMGLATRP